MKQLLNILSVITRRWASKSPKRYKWVTNISLILGVILAGVSFTPLGLPVWAITLIGYVSTFLVLLSGGSKLTTTDNEIIKETKKILKTENK